MKAMPISSPSFRAPSKGDEGEDEDKRIQLIVNSIPSSQTRKLCDWIKWIADLMTVEYEFECRVPILF